MGQFSIYILSKVPTILLGLKYFFENSSKQRDECYSFFYLDNFKNSLKYIKETCPNVLLVDDYGFKKDEFNDYLTDLLSMHNRIKIILYSGCTDPLYLKNLADKGIRGFVHKKSPIENIFLCYQHYKDWRYLL